MAAEVEDRLKKMVVERWFLKLKPEEIDEAKSLIDGYGVDSVSLLELVVGIEEEFGVVIEDDEFDVRHFETIAALSEFIQVTREAAFNQNRYNVQISVFPFVHRHHQFIVDIARFSTL